MRFLLGKSVLLWHGLDSGKRAVYQSSHERAGEAIAIFFSPSFLTWSVDSLRPKWQRVNCVLTTGCILARRTIFIVGISYCMPFLTAQHFQASPFVFITQYYSTFCSTFLPFLFLIFLMEVCAQTTWGKVWHPVNGCHGDQTWKRKTATTLDTLRHLTSSTTVLENLLIPETWQTQAFPTFKAFRLKRIRAGLHSGLDRRN